MMSGEEMISATMKEERMKKKQNEDSRKEDK